MHDFRIANADTDSIMFCRNDMLPFSREEQYQLIEEINSLLPEKIRMAHDGYFTNVVIIKAKNYSLKDESGKVKIKGAALKGTTKAKALQKYLLEIINLLLTDKQNEIVDLYHKYVKEAMNLSDISDWCNKKTVSAKVLNPERTNEKNILEAMGDKVEDYSEGDKIWTYFDVDGKLQLRENWNKDHDPYKLLQSLWDTTKIFETVLDIKLFEKYHLKTKRKLLETIL